MNNDKLENIYKLLSEYNFDVNKNVPDKFKCRKCRKILIKACQTQCGCRFCRSCVDEMMNNGCQFCPGITSDCKTELLSTVQLDYRANNQISKLIMKCPEQMCSFECELLEMNEHLRICGKKNVECPFYKLGCDMRKMTNEKLIEHFQLENYNHNKTLIDMIDIIKNEIEELREKELKNHESIKLEMEILKAEKLEMEKQMKTVEENLNDEIVTLKANHEKELQSIKTEKEELVDKLQIALRNIWNKIDEIESEVKEQSEVDKIESELEERSETDKNESVLNEQLETGKFRSKLVELPENNEIKSELEEPLENDNVESIKSELIKKTDYLQINLDNKSINDDIKLEMEASKLTIDKSLWQIEIEQKINQLERKVENKTNEIFEMMVYNIHKMSRIRNGKLSEYFYARNHSYKLRLNIFVTYLYDLHICLHICDDVLNQNLSFPFKADVTIKAVNINKREVSESIIKYCEIEKPSTYFVSFSDKFIFQFWELQQKGIWESNCCIIECFVDLK